MSEKLLIDDWTAAGGVPVGPPDGLAVGDVDGKDAEARCAHSSRRYSGVLPRSE